MEIRRLGNAETPPYDLLLLADPSLVLVERYLKEGECFLYEMDGEIIGVFVLLMLNPETVEIKNVAVSEAMQGKGIGKQLVQAAIRLADEIGYRNVEIGTGNSSVNQLALYQKCGFRIVEIIHDFFTFHYKEEIVENGIVCRDMIRLRMELS
ncbi:GNAT family N-acetyltransferase [Sporosarcina cyprini]|uniref:GNAT family N-acetyltransferase n=1 Tax=Sporosarcina cyprini TaxID=2910523 RepID=UPI001EDEFE3F|nr:GNAT family N-acetyltransferase [Sporosarcina cyprini]MCG3086864.1 GNAT family N-acetyltransferase [Sporosarcina cyprini]